MSQKLTDNPLYSLLEEFSKHDKKIKANVKTKVKTEISFQERSRLANEQLLKQLPVTLNQARAQVLHIKIRSASKTKEQKDEEIKENLRMYLPELCEAEINDGFFRLYNIYDSSFRTI